MSLSTTGVSIVLMIIWGVSYLVLKKYIYSAKLYFVLLLIMSSAGLLIPELPLMGLYPDKYILSNIILFAFLMIVTIIPWISFDKLYKHKLVFTIKDKYISSLKLTFIVTILLSFIAIIYLLPYAIRSFLIGAQEIRSIVSNESILPQTLLTTFAVGISALYPITIMFVYITLLDTRLSKYTVFLIISSLTYLVSNTAITGRDGFIFIPLIYIILFFVFKYSISKDKLKKIKRYGIITATLLIIIISSVTIDRFYNNSSYISQKDSKQGLIYGTWGYFYQQPYVFDHVIEDFKSFYGFKRRLKFLDKITEVKGKEYDKNKRELYEMMFGTQYAEFYQISGYTSLIIFTIIFLWLFKYLAIRYRRNKNHFSQVISFAIYLNFTITGMFYFRIGTNNGEFLLNLALILATFFIPNIFQIKYCISNQMR